MKVLVTGATGFIGRHCAAQLAASGVEVHGVYSRAPLELEGVRWRRADLLDPGACRDLIETVRPTHLLHLAWNAAPGIYWTTPENLKWVQSSLALAMAFQAAGGQRLVAAGTCAEYDWAFPVADEVDTPTRPATLYGACKNALNGMLAPWGRAQGLSYAWGRIFSLYGPHEYPQRLAASVAVSLLQNRVAELGDGSLVRDYLHVEDVASAFVALLGHDIQGPVNIASGAEVRLADIVGKIGDLTGRRELIRFGARPRPASEPDRLIGDNTRLLSTGWAPRWSLEDGLAGTLEWWRGQIANGAHA